MDEFINLAIEVIRKQWPSRIELPVHTALGDTYPVYEAVLSYEIPTAIAIFHPFKNAAKVVCQAFGNVDELGQYAAAKIKNPKYVNLPDHAARYFTYEGTPASIRKVTPVPKTAVAAGPQVEGLPSEAELLHLITETFGDLGVRP